MDLEPCTAGVSCDAQVANGRMPSGGPWNSNQAPLYGLLAKLWDLGSSAHIGELSRRGSTIIIGRGRASHTHMCRIPAADGACLAPAHIPACVSPAAGGEGPGGVGGGGDWAKPRLRLSEPGALIRA